MTLHSKSKARRLLLLVLFLLCISSSGKLGTVAAQDDQSRILVNVVLVQLNVAVTDHKGNYISGLRPEDFAITEDKIPQTLSTFEEGNGPTLRPETHGAGSIAQAALPASSAATAETQLSQFAG